MRMRRIAWLLAIVLVLTLVLAGCGKKDAGSVVKDLNRAVDKMDSYAGSGRMILNTGIEPQEYKVDVWYKAPSYYRISLTNAKKDITQIVLRNDDGVFVLTPHLNKSFRFQSDWPDNQGQVYLYQSLVQSIAMDGDRQFTTDGDAYVFDVLANYQNASLARQKIWLSKKNYAPQQVEISDSNANVMVTFTFDTFEFDKKFDDDSFDMQRNMTSYDMKTIPTTATADGAAQGATKAGDKAATSDAGNGAAKSAAGSTGTGTPGTTGTSSGTTNGTTSAATNGKTSSTAAAGSSNASAVKDGAGSVQATSSTKSPAFGIIEPTYTPKGVKQSDIGDVKLGDTNGVLLRYNGTYSYSLIESAPEDRAVSTVLEKGTVVDLGYTFAELVGDKHKTMIWTYDGIEYRLSTDNLPDNEMMKVAQSVQGIIGK